MRRCTVLLLALPLIILGATATVGADEKSVPEIKTLAGTWMGQTRCPARTWRATLFVKEDGSYDNHREGMIPSAGTVTIENGKLRYQSTISAGRAEFSEDARYQYLTLVPDTGVAALCKGEYQREKIKK